MTASSLHGKAPIPETDEAKPLPVTYTDAPRTAAAVPTPMEVCFPDSWRSTVSFVTDEHDGTYGSYQGIKNLSECQKCGAWVEDKEKHVSWHVRLEL